ncbi:hypothetical protein BCR32DRAFT_266126 [Anaeromyces robustus]|uniref:Extracellular membrane protein CFEM domain-containing protein n=1 Tax=Anaeromyces robustus TaxID=1754192 RepID=A0A1Y1XG81_9FUNG|nr:hypothetical protein BCR32DRAFT_266126 [Anaeromyces robustus]|eukprot:ORX84768.1 hypothetical protein BCR32DRAFT_266126 [Anaeromyces robustus]
MKSYLLFTLVIAYLVAFAKSQQCDKLAFEDCVRIRTESRDNFCSTKQEELAKCNCVYDSLIVACYDLCSDQETLAARQQLEAEMNSQCSAASIDPKNIPANVYNEAGVTNTGNQVTTQANQANQASQANQANQANPMATTAPGTTQGTQNGSQVNTTPTKDDFADGAESNTFYTTLIVANIMLVISLLI